MKIKEKRNAFIIFLVFFVCMIISIKCIDSLISYHRYNKILLLNLPEDKIISNQVIIDVLLFGDSRISQWPNNMLGHREIMNLGRGGMTSSQGIQLIRGYINAFIPKVVVIQLGINDIMAIGMIKDETDKNRAINLCTDNLVDIVSICLEKDIIVVFISIIYPRMSFFMNHSTIIDGINEAIHSSFSNESNFLFIDLNKYLTKNNRLLFKFSIDNLHFSMKGYNVISNKIINILEVLPKEEE